MSGSGGSGSSSGKRKAASDDGRGSSNGSSAATTALGPHLEWPQLVGSQLVGTHQLRGAVGEPERLERPRIGEWRLGLERDVVGALVVAALGRRPRGAVHDARGAHRR